MARWTSSVSWATSLVIFENRVRGAVQEILDVADRLDVDMIILGSHSKGRLHYAFLGSVSEKILRKTHRTVVIVPPEK